MTSQYATPEYQFILRNLRTLAIVDEIAPQDVSTASWTRNWRGGGGWQIAVPINSRYTSTMFAVGNLQEQLLHITRGGVDEFFGVLEKRTADPLGKMWVIGGRDITAYWLQQRIVGETVTDNRAGVGETVLKQYVNAYLGSTAAAPRAGSTFLTGMTFTVAADTATGLTVNGSANRTNLFTLTQSLCEAAVLTQQVAYVASTGYQYRTGAVADHTTANTGAVPFSVNWDNVEKLTFSEDYTQYRNYHYVAGDGVGAARNVTVYDATLSGMRHESVIDAKEALTVNQRTTIGALDALKRTRSLVGVTAKPFKGSANAVYRTDFDLGWLITFSEPRLRAAAVNLPIAAITVTLGDGGEDISFDLGQANPDDVMRRYQEAITAMQTTQAAG